MMPLPMRFLVACGILLLSSALARAQFEYHPIALSYFTTLSSDQAPGTAGFFDKFTAPMINAAGEVAFSATLRTGLGDANFGNNQAIWAGLPGDLALVARKGQIVPDGIGVDSALTYSSVGQPYLTDFGQIAFNAGLSGPQVTSDNDAALFAGPYRTDPNNLLGAVRMVIRDAEDDEGVRHTYSMQASNVQLLDQETGASLQHLAISHTRRSDTINDSGISRIDVSSLGGEATVEQIVVAGTGTADGMEFNLGQFKPSSINSSGDVIFPAGVGNNSALIAGGPGNLQFVMLEDTPPAADPRLPMLGQPPNQGEHVFSKLDPTPIGPSLNDVGNAMFAATLDASNPGGRSDPNFRASGIFVGRSPTGPVVLAKDPVELEIPTGTTTVQFGGFGAQDAVFNNQDETAFVASLIPGIGGVTPSNNLGLWITSGGELQLLARKGDDAPGVQGDYKFREFSNLHLNDKGQVAFIAGLDPKAAGGGSQALYLSDPDGQLQLVAQLGQPLIPDDPDDPNDRVYLPSQIMLLGSAGSADGRRSSLNDDGILTFQLNLGGPREGIFTVFVPAGDPIDYYWRADAFDANWHSLSNDETNWRDKMQTVHSAPPGDNGDEIVVIRDAPSAGVILDQRSVAIGSLDQKGLLVIEGQSLVLNGESTLDRIKLVSAESAIATIVHNDTLTLFNDARIFNGSNTSAKLVSNGHLVKLGTHEARIEVAYLLLGTGNVSVQEGALRIMGHMETLGGRFEVAPSAELIVTEDVEVKASTLFSGIGSDPTSTQSTGITRLFDGTFTVLPATVATADLRGTDDVSGLQLDGVDLELFGEFRNLNSTDWRSGVIASSAQGSFLNKGRLTVLGSIEGHQLHGVLRNAFGANLVIEAGSGIEMSGATINNFGTVTARYGTLRPESLELDGGSVLHQSGATLIKESEKTFAFDVPVHLLGGQVQIDGGELQLLSGGQHTGGFVSIASDSALEFRGEHTANGPIVVSGGTTYLDGASTTLTIAAGSLEFLGGTTRVRGATVIGAGGPIRNSGQVIWEHGTIGGGVVEGLAAQNGFLNRSLLMIQSSATHTVNGVLRNSGYVSQLSDIQFGEEGVVFNEESGIWQLGAGLVVPSNGRIINLGQFQQAAATSSTIEGDFSNRGGRIRVLDRGNLTLDGTVTSDGSGNWTIQSEAAMRLSQNAVAAVSDRLTVEGAGKAVLEGQLSLMSGSVTSIALRGEDGFAIEDGGHATPALQIDGRLTNRGNMRWKGGSIGMGEGGQWYNARGGELTIDHADDAHLPGLISNDGEIIVKSNVSGSTDELRIDNSRNRSPASLIVLDRPGGVTNQLRLAARLSNQGTVIVNDDTWAVVGPVDEVHISPATLGAGLVLDAGTWEIRDGASLTLTSREHAGVDDYPIVNFSRNVTVIIHGSGEFRNLGFALVGELPGNLLVNEGNLQLLDGASHEIGDGSFVQQGRLTVGEESQMLLTHSSFRAMNGSKTTIDGDLTVLGDNGQPSRVFIEFEEGSSVQGEGTINGQRFDNHGNLLPGNSPGTLTLNVEQFVQGPEGRIVAEIAGPAAGEQYDQLLISGTATLGGTLELQLLEDETRELFRPADGAPFQVVNAAGGIEGAFDNVIFNTPGVLADLDVDYIGGDVVVTVLTTSLLGDFDHSDNWTSADLDLLAAEVAAGSHNPIFDLTADSLVDANDIAEFLTYVHSIAGDADLDGIVSDEDYLTLAANYGQPATWSQGDFDANGFVQFADFVLLARGFEHSGNSPSEPLPVPEPFGSPWVFSANLLLLLLRRRRR